MDLGGQLEVSVRSRGLASANAQMVYSGNSEEASVAAAE